MAGFGGLGGLGGIVNSRGAGNMLQALGMSLMSSPRNAPLANFGKFYGGLQDRQMRQDALDQERSDTLASRDAMAQALIASGVPEQEARTLAINPAAAKLRLDQISAQQESAARQQWLSGLPDLLGGTGGSAEPATAEIAPETTSAPTQTQFGLPGVSQLDPYRFSAGNTTPDTGALEPVADLPQTAQGATPSGNKTLDWLNQNDPEAAKLVDQGFSVRDAFEIAQERRKTMGGDQPAAQQAQQQPSRLDQLYRIRDQIAAKSPRAPLSAVGQTKLYLDAIDTQIKREEDRQKAGQAPDSVRALQMRAELAGLQPGTKEYNDFMVAGGRGPLVSVNTGNNNSKFVEKSDEAAAARLNDIVVAGQTAPQTMADMQQLIDLGAQIGTGKDAQIKAFLGPYAQAIGIDIDNLGEMQAYEAITSRLAPQMRAAGSGSSSDRDVSMFLQSLPNLRNTQGGNEIIANTMKAVAQNKINAADIASKAQRGEISWQDADKQIRELPNPYELFKQFQKETTTGKLPDGVTEEDIQHTMQKHGLSREEVLRRIGAQ
ncbi:MAG: hypothetical protein WA975_03400 [Mesorhizobium sp.]